MQRYHFISYTPDQTILFPERIDKDIAEDDPVRMVSGIVESLDLSGMRKLYKERGRLYMMLGENEAAIQDIRHASDIDPSLMEQIEGKYSI